jgi:fatty-acyl-CoA synthase
VLHGQRSIARHARDVAAALRMNESGTTVLAAVPLRGTFGLAFAMAAAAGGAHIVLMDQFDAAQACTLIRQLKITHAVGSDDMLARIAHAANGRPFECLRFSGFASFTPMAAQNVAAADALGMMPRGLYGSSEAQALFAFAPDTRRTSDGGVPASSEAEFRIADPDSGLSMPDGEDGELLLRAPSLFDGYLDDPQATARASTEEGFFRSGDLARRTEPGFVYKTRLGDGLRLGGFLVFPKRSRVFCKPCPALRRRKSSSSSTAPSVSHSLSSLPMRIVSRRKANCLPPAAARSPHTSGRHASSRCKHSRRRIVRTASRFSAPSCARSRERS